MPKHLILANEHLALSLIESALVTAGQRPRLAAVGADRRGAQPGRGVTAGGPGPVAQIGPGHVERAAGKDGGPR